MFKKPLCLVLILLTILSLTAVPASAAEDDYINGMDKGYITFIFDDNRSCTKEVYELFKKYDMPVSCAVIASAIENNTNMQKNLMDIQNSGGEILSHTYSHKVFTEDSCDLNKVDMEFSKSYRVLTDLGFNVNGIIETGNGGGENSAPKELIETVTKKYYKYSNGYGVSPQFKESRIWLSSGFKVVKEKINSAAENNEWLILSAHDFDEMGKSALEALLQYIAENDKLEVVTWNYMYRTFGTNPESITPTGKVESNTQSPTANTEATTPSTNITEPDESVNTDIEVQPVTAYNYTALIIIGIIAAVLVIAAAIIIPLLIKRKKKT